MGSHREPVENLLGPPDLTRRKHGDIHPPLGSLGNLGGGLLESQVPRMGGRQDVAQPPFHRFHRFIRGFIRPPGEGTGGDDHRDSENTHESVHH